MARKLVLVMGSFFPREGGAERQLRHVLSRIDATEWDIHVVTRGIRGEPGFSTIDGLSVHRVGIPSLRFTSLSMLDGLGFLISGSRMVRRLRPETVLSTQLGSSSLLALVGTLGLNCRRIIRLTGGGSGEFKSEAEARAKSRTGKMLVSLLGRTPYTLVAPARHLLEGFETFFSLVGPSAVIPNGVKRAESETPHVRQVAWYSRAGSQKSTDLFRSLVTRMSDVQFTVFGADIGFTSRNVRHEGWVSEPEMLIAQHCVLLNTSAQEGMPNTVLQAIGSGVRVVGFSNDGMLEVSSDYPGFITLVPFGNLEELEVALRNSLTLKYLAPAEVPDYQAVSNAWMRLLS